MSLILCIEAGTDIGSVALADDDKLLSLRECSEGKQHASNLAVYVEEILSENDLSASELSAVAVGKGPGSYTGLRIATSLAKGICYAARIPLVTVSSLEAMAYVALEDWDAGIVDMDEIEGALLLPMIDARRMEVYCQLFDSRVNPVDEVRAEIITEESFAQERKNNRILVFGNGAQKCKDIFTGPGVIFSDIVPSARGLVKPAYNAFRENKFENIAYFEPFYLKDFVATTSAKRYF